MKATIVTTIEPYVATWHDAYDPENLGRLHFDRAFPVRLEGGGCLELPLRALPGGEKAIALLMSNQTSFRVERKLADRLTSLVRPLAPEVIVGIPTLGLNYASRVAEGLGLADYVALGMSKKFWYDEQLSEPVISSTSPGDRKSVFIDPSLLERVRGRRVVIVDDVINSGKTIAAAVKLILRAGGQINGLALVLTEGHDWRRELLGVGPEFVSLVRALGHIPLFSRTAAGWQPMPETC